MLRLDSLVLHGSVYCRRGIRNLHLSRAFHIRARISILRSSFCIAAWLGSHEGLVYFSMGVRHSRHLGDHLCRGWIGGYFFWGGLFAIRSRLLCLVWFLVLLIKVQVLARRFDLMIRKLLVVFQILIFLFFSQL